MIRVLVLLMLFTFITTPTTFFMAGASNLDAATVYIDEKFRGRALLLSSHVCEVGTGKTSESLEFMDAPSKALYTGSVIIKSLAFPNRIVSNYGGKYSAVYRLRIAEIYYNRITEEWNLLVADSCSIGDGSTDTEIYLATQKMGEFGGKTSYLILRAFGVEPYKAFMEGAYDMAKDQEVNKKIRGQIRSRYGAEEARIYDGFMAGAKTAGGFVANVAAPVADMIFYEAFGIVGHEMAPQLLKSANFAEDTFKNEIVPRSREFFRDTKVVPTEEFGKE